MAALVALVLVRHGIPPRLSDVKGRSRLPVHKQNGCRAASYGTPRATTAAAHLEAAIDPVSSTGAGDSFLSDDRSSEANAFQELIPGLPKRDPDLVRPGRQQSLTVAGVLVSSSP